MSVCVKLRRGRPRSRLQENDSLAESKSIDYHVSIHYTCSSYIHCYVAPRMSVLGSPRDGLYSLLGLHVQNGRSSVNCELRSAQWAASEPIRGN